MTDANLTPKPPVAAKTPHGIKLALAVSVAINLGVAGLVGGLMLNDGPGGRSDRMVRDLGFGPFDAAFSPEDRRVLRRQVMGQMGDFKVIRQQMQGDIAAIVTALRADPYDPAAMSAAFDLQTGHLADRLKLGTVIVRDYLVALPPEERLEFADRLDHAMQHGPDHGDMGPQGRAPDGKASGG